MKNPIRFSAMAGILALAVSAAYAQSDDSQDISSTSQTTTIGSFRSDGAAIASVLSRRSPEEGQAIVRTLQNIEQHSGGNLGRNTGFDATKNLILSAASSSDGSIVQTAWDNMEDFDRQALTILARSAYFGGLDQGVDGGQERPLRFFQANDPWWNTTRTEGLVVQSPNMRALDTVVGKFGANGDEFRNAIMSIQSNQSGGMRNMGYVNAEKILMDAVGVSDSSGSFQSAWTSLDPSDREGALILVRQAVFGGLNKL